MSTALVPRSPTPLRRRDPDVIDLRPLPSAAPRPSVWRVLFVLAGFVFFLIHATTLLLGAHPFLQ